MTSPAQAFAQLHRLAPADAVAYLRQRGRIATTYSWQDLWQDEHSHQFTVSRLASADLLQTMRDKISASVNGDLTRRDFIRDAKAALSEAGWWGRKEVIEPATGEILRTTFNATRLQLIFDVNTRQAYAAGQWERLQRTKASHPYLRYITKRDERVRAAHAAWDNVTLPIDHPFWASHYPPNGFNCRCRVVAVSQREYDRGTTPSGGPLNKNAPEVMWRQWINQRTGQVETIPAGIDPGFAYNPGISAARSQLSLVRNKLSALDAPTGAALWAGLRSSQAQTQLLDWQVNVQRLANTGKPLGDTHLIHAIDAPTQKALQAQGVQLDSAAILMRDTELMHALRDTKAARSAAIPQELWANLPSLINQATPYLDTQDQALIYAIPMPDGRLAKVIVRLSYADKARLGRTRQRVMANFIQTGGVVEAINLTTGRQYLKLNE